MKTLLFLLATVVLPMSISCSSPPPDETTGDKLRRWRRGVWQLSDGSYAIYTDAHYFVVSASGDSVRQNVYCGGSRIAITDKGMAREQRLRVRMVPGGELRISKDAPLSIAEARASLQVDLSLFQPGTCNIEEGIIYDSVTEVSDTCIVLATCNGDREKIFSDGRSAYMPATGGEYWARRIESW